MTIHTNRGTRLIKIECDNCGEMFDPGTADFNEALLAADSAGWSQMEIAPKKWEHHCSAKCRQTCEATRRYRG